MSRASSTTATPGTIPAERRVFSVSTLNQTVRGLLDDVFGEAWVEGEISNLRRIASGHWYFTLKDDQAQVSCAMFRGHNRRLRFDPRDGMQVTVRGRVSLYEARGTYQIVVEHMEEGGEGALLRAFEALKQKLDREGLFDPASKRDLPPLPRHIGVITSPGGAALRDVLSVLERRFPAIPVRVYASAVQGQQAPAQLLAALTIAIQRRECDVLLLTRGGGSLEDLWAFNDEALARAIHASPIPIISAVGHEIDYTIADFVADRRAATPSAAAELLSPDQADWRRLLQQQQQRLAGAAERRLQQLHKQLDGISGRLQRGHPGRRIEAGNQRLDELSQRLERAMRGALQRRGQALIGQRAALLGHNPRHRLERMRGRCEQLTQRLRQATRTGLERRSHALQRCAATLHAVSPLATLERGYAIVTRRHDGTVVQHPDQLGIGDPITARLAFGELDCVVEARRTIAAPKAPTSATTSGKRR